MLEIVCWNLEARNIHFATSKDQPNIRFVSGSSSKVLDSIINGVNLTQEKFVKEALKNISL